MLNLLLISLGVTIKILQNRMISVKILPDEVSWNTLANEFSAAESEVPFVKQNTRQVSKLCVSCYCHATNK